jgi:membrane protein
MGTNQSDHVQVRGPVSLLRWLFYLLRDTYLLWYQERTIRLGAGLAYYGIFAIVPLLTLSVALAQLVFSQADVQQFLTDQLVRVFGQQEATDIAAKLTEILDSGSTTSNLGLFGLISLIVAASLVFVALQDALNVIWQQPRLRGWRNLFRRYGLAYAVVLLMGSLLVASLVVQSVAGLAEELIPGQLAVLESLANLVAMLASWALGIGVLTVLFKILPHTSVPWRASLIGAVVTAGAMAIGSWAIGAYLSRYSTSSLAGAAGSIVMVLLWIYYIAQILLAGAVLTRIVTDRLNPPQDKPASTNS